MVNRISEMIESYKYDIEDIKNQFLRDMEEFVQQQKSVLVVCDSELENVKKEVEG